MKVEVTPIGVIHSPHREATGTPIQPRWAAGIEGTVDVFPQFAPGLRDLDGFERVWGGEHHAADGGSYHAGAVEHHRIHRNGIGNIFLANQFRSDGLACGGIKGSDHACQCCQKNHVPFLNDVSKGQPGKDEGQ